MRTTLDLPDEVFRQLKAEAALRGAKLKDLIAQYIEKGLADRAAPRGERRARSPLPTLRSGNGDLHPSLSNIELECLLNDDDAPARP